MKPRDFTHFSQEALMEELKALADDLSQDPRALIIEAMDRLELISIEAVDLAHGLSKARQDSDFWQQKATEAMNRNRKLEEAGDRLAYWYEPKELRQFDALNNWKQAKEDKP